MFNGTEANPEFASDIQETLQASGKKGAVLVCNVGGTLEPSQTNALGRQSRLVLLCTTASLQSNVHCEAALVSLGPVWEMARVVQDLGTAYVSISHMLVP